MKFTLLLTNTLTLGFTPQVAQKLEHDFTEWELPNSFQKSLPTLKF